MLTAAFLRARQVVTHVGLKDAGPLERVPSLLNEVWYAGPYVIRVSADPNVRRLRYESLLSTYLPDEVGYPEIVTYGRAEFAEWLVIRRIKGEPLSRAWPNMSPRDRHTAIESLARRLRSLHDVPPSAIGELTPPFTESDNLDCPHQLPAARVRELIERARHLRFVSHQLLDQAHVLVNETEGAADADPTGLIHGDLHFENVLWDGTEVNALVDFEWARPGVPELDLDVILRFCADPFLHVADDYAHLAKRADYREVPTLLREHYPELFSYPRVRDRLRLFSLSYELRHLLLKPPMAKVEVQDTFHPYNRMQRVIEARSHLEWIQW